MAISTTTTIDDFLYANWVEPYLLAAASELASISPLARQFNLVGKPSNGIKIATAGSLWGTPDDVGAGVDTEYNAAEDTDLTSTTFSTGVVTASASEYGVRVDLSDTIMEDAIDALELLRVIEESMLGALMFALDDDMCALFAGLSNSVGSSGNDLTIAQLLAAQVGLRVRGNKAPNGAAYVLSNTQVDDVEAALIATNAAAAVYSFAADRFLGALPGEGFGMNNGNVMFFRGCPVFASGLCDTANGGADEVGACFVHSTAGNDAFAAFGLIMKRAPRLRTQRDESARSTELVLTMRAAPFELRDIAGTKIVTDA